MVGRNVMASLLAAVILVIGLMPANGSLAYDGHPAEVMTAAETAAEFGLLIGEGNGVNAEYLDKKSTRMQAAIISLRLQGLLEEALIYSGVDNFADADQAGSESNMAILAYLRNHPELGWQGTGNGYFHPLDEISAQQFYKVLLEVMGYRSGEHYLYEETESFAAETGMKQIAGIPALVNNHLAIALIEALTAHTSAEVTLFDTLQARGVLSPAVALPNGGEHGPGHGRPGEEDTGNVVSQPGVYRIDINNFSFGTEPLIIEAGSQVVFTNYDDMAHNAVALDGSFATPLLAGGESFTITLNEPGTYEYVCEPHRTFMTGVIIVQ